MGNTGDSRTIMLYPGNLQLLKGLNLYRLLFPKPVLVVNREGIFNNPLSLWFVNLKMSISWEEIAAIYLQELTLHGKKGTKTYHLLCILPKDFAGFVEREQLGGRGRFAVLGAMAASDAPFMIFEKTIFPHGLDELFDRIRESYQEEIQAHGIDIREKQQVTHG